MNMLLEKLVDQIENASKENPDPDVDDFYIPDEQARAAGLQLLQSICELPQVQKAIEQMTNRALMENLNEKISNPAVLALISEKLSKNITTDDYRKCIKEIRKESSIETPVVDEDRENTLGYE